MELGECGGKDDLRGVGRRESMIRTHCMKWLSIKKIFKAEPIKVLEENTWENLYDIRYYNNFLYKKQNISAKRK